MSFADTLRAAGLLTGPHAVSELPDEPRSDLAAGTLTPGERQVIALKERLPGVVLFIENGFRFRLYGSDAVLAAKHLGIYAHLDRAGGGHFYVASVPVHRIGVHVRRLVLGQGCVVGVVKQIDTAAAKAAGLSADGKKSGTFARALVGLYSPATLAHDDAVAGALLRSGPRLAVAGRSSGVGRAGRQQSVLTVDADAYGADGVVDDDEAAAADDDADDGDVPAGGHGGALTALEGASQAGPLVVVWEGVTAAPATTPAGGPQLCTALLVVDAAGMRVGWDAWVEAGGAAKCAAADVVEVAEAEAEHGCPATEGCGVAGPSGDTSPMAGAAAADGLAPLQRSRCGGAAGDVERVGLASRLASVPASEVLTSSRLSAESRQVVLRYAGGGSGGDGPSAPGGEEATGAGACSLSGGNAGPTVDAHTSSSRVLVTDGGASKRAFFAACAAAEAVDACCNAATARESGLLAASGGAPAAIDPCGGDTTKRLSRYAAASPAPDRASAASVRAQVRPPLPAHAGSTLSGGSSTGPADASELLLALQSVGLSVDIPFFSANSTSVAYAWQVPALDERAATGEGSGAGVTRSGAQQSSAKATVKSAASKASRSQAAALPTHARQRGDAERTGAAGGAAAPVPSFVLQRSANGLFVVTTGAEVAHLLASEPWAGGAPAAPPPGDEASDAAGASSDGRATASGPSVTDPPFSTAGGSKRATASGKFPAAAGPAKAAVGKPAPSAALAALGKASISHYFGAPGAAKASSLAGTAKRFAASVGAARDAARLSSPDARTARASSSSVRDSAAGARASALASSALVPSAALSAGSGSAAVTAMQASAVPGVGNKRPRPGTQGAEEAAAEPARPSPPKRQHIADSEVMDGSSDGSVVVANDDNDDDVVVLSSQEAEPASAPTAPGSGAVRSTRASSAARSLQPQPPPRSSPVRLPVPVPLPTPAQFAQPSRVLLHVMPAAVVEALARQQLTSGAAGSRASSDESAVASSSPSPPARERTTGRVAGLQQLVSGIAASSGLSPGLSQVLQQCAVAAHAFLLPFGKAAVLGHAQWTRLGDSQAGAISGMQEVSTTRAGPGSAVPSAARDGSSSPQPAAPPALRRLQVPGSTLVDLGVLPRSRGVGSRGAALLQPSAGAAKRGAASQSVPAGAAAGGLVAMYCGFAATGAGRREVTDWLTRPLADAVAISARLGALDCLCDRCPACGAGSGCSADSTVRGTGDGYDAEGRGAGESQSFASASAGGSASIGGVGAAASAPRTPMTSLAEGASPSLLHAAASSAALSLLWLLRSPLQQGGTVGRGRRGGVRAGAAASAAGPPPDLHTLCGRLLQGRASPAQTHAAASWLQRAGHALQATLQPAALNSLLSAASETGTGGALGAIAAAAPSPTNALVAATLPVMRALLLPLQRGMASLPASASSAAASAARINTSVPLPTAILDCFAEATEDSGSAGQGTTISGPAAPSDGSSARLDTGAVLPMATPRLRDSIAAGLQPGLRQWQRALADAKQGLQAELGRAREVLGKPSLQWSSLRTGVNSTLECLLEVRRTELASPLRPLRIPSAWEEVSATKELRRFRTPETAALLSQREAAREMLQREREAAWRRWQTEVAAPQLVPSLLLPLAAALGQLDALAAFACVSLQPGYCRPQVRGRDAPPFVSVLEGRHPVMEHAGRLSVVAGTGHAEGAEGGVDLGAGASASSSSVAGAEHDQGEAGVGAGRVSGGQQQGFQYIPSSIALGGPLLPGAAAPEEMLSSGAGGHAFSGTTADIAARGPAFAAPIMVLTGPNAAGKSMAVRMLGCLVLQAQAGSYVAAEAMSVGVLDAVQSRMGSADDLVAGLSSFATEMRQTAQMLAYGDARRGAASPACVAVGGDWAVRDGVAVEDGVVVEQETPGAPAASPRPASWSSLPRVLLLFDELGRATSTRDGTAIACATLRYTALQWARLQARAGESRATGLSSAATGPTACALLPRPAFLPLAVFVTHFRDLTSLPEREPALAPFVANAHMSFLLEGKDGDGASASGVHHSAGADGGAASDDVLSGGPSTLSTTNSSRNRAVGTEDLLSSGDLVFLYRLTEGPAPASYGLAVALRAGLPRHIVQRAQLLASTVTDV